MGMPFWEGATANGAEVVSRFVLASGVLFIAWGAANMFEHRRVTIYGTVMVAFGLLALYQVWEVLTNV